MVSRDKPRKSHFFLMKLQTDDDKERRALTFQ